MGFWWFMLMCNLLIPIIMIVAGLLMHKNGPKKINSLYGYRTTRSMQNTDTWKFANEYCGRLLWIIGIVTVIPSSLVMIPFYGSSEDTIGFVGMIVSGVQLVVLILSIIPTELALKKTFNDDGTRR